MITEGSRSVRIRRKMQAKYAQNARRSAHQALRSWLRVGITTCVLLSPLSALQAQIVRGRVTQETSAAPVIGALVELVFADSGDVRAASALSDGSGAFELRAPAPGRYRIGAKRIGVRRYLGAPFVLAVGETHNETIVLAQVEYRLPEVVVTASALCVISARDRSRVTALWDEARTALDATQISLRDRLFSAEVTRYVRDLDPKTRKVLGETQSNVRGVVTSPFNALPPDSLAALGYWQRNADSSVTYYGPDATVLLSDAFLDDHCFRPVEGTGNRRGLVGLAFAPVGGRRVPDVNGTLWLDDKTFALQLVDFAYDRLVPGLDTAAIGGELHFAQLPNGAWLVRSWFLRVPVRGRSEQPLSTEGSAPWILLRSTDYRLREEGGTVTTDAMRSAMRPARITGVVRDSSGSRPLAGADVTLGETPRSVRTDARGAFTFDSVTPGSATLAVHAAGYDALGIVAAEGSVQLAEGVERNVTLTALDARALTMRLCKGEPAGWGRGTITGVVRDASTGAAVAGVRATATWQSTLGQAAGDSVAQSAMARSDSRGRYTFCQVPSDRRVTIRVAAREGATPVHAEVVLGAREVRRVDVTLPGAKPNE